MNSEPRRLFSLKELDEHCMSVLRNLVLADIVGSRKSKAEAAHELVVSIPAISSRLKTLQKFIGSPIIDKKKAHTPIGTSMSTLWERVRPALENFIVEVEELKDSRLLRVSSIRSVWDIEGDWIEFEYSSRVRGGKLAVKYADSYEVAEAQVRRGEVDIGIVSFPPEQLAPSIKMEPWRDEPMDLVLSFARAERLQGQLTIDVAARATRVESTGHLTIDVTSVLEDLHHTFFVMEERASMYEPVNEFLRKNKINFKYKIPTRTFDEVLMKIREDKGISILPRPVVMNAFRPRSTDNSRFTEGEIDYIGIRQNFKRPIAIIYREDTLKAKLQDVFLAILKKYKERPPEDEE